MEITRVEKEQENFIIGAGLGRKSSGHQLRELLLAEDPVTIVDPTGEYDNLVDLLLNEE